jgi:hypothetical protein
MLALAVSLLFGLAALAAVAVIHSSLVVGIRRARLILAELDEIERQARVTRPAPAGSPPQLALRPAFAAA